MLNTDNKDISLLNGTTVSIPDNILLIEKRGQGLIAGDPVKLDTVIAIICLTGKISGSLNLIPFEAEAPGLFIALPGQIIHSDHFSNDFHGLGIVMSKDFWNGFDIDLSLEFPVSRSILENPWIRLSTEEMETMTDYFRLMQKTIRKQENINRSEAVRYLTMAFFHGFGYQYHKISEDSQKTTLDVLSERFLLLVRENYRDYREVKFYAGKLSLTPKYLSWALKQHSGKTAAEWIENHIILEARALLRSTSLSIGQISDELNFPSQSFFGKYFKRRVGISPSEYRKR